jgi:hypothetical protein
MGTVGCWNSVAVHSIRPPPPFAAAVPTPFSAVTVPRLLLAAVPPLGLPPCAAISTPSSGNDAPASTGLKPLGSPGTCPVRIQPRLGAAVAPAVSLIGALRGETTSVVTAAAGGGVVSGGGMFHPCTGQNPGGNSVPAGYAIGGGMTCSGTGWRAGGSPSVRVRKPSPWPSARAHDDDEALQRRCGGGCAVWRPGDEREPGCRSGSHDGTREPQPLSPWKPQG